ncbi:MAG: hypothetical protein ABI041_04915, partial [Bdellovibrionia bacterium]
MNHLIQFTFGLILVFSVPAFSEDFTQGIRIESTQVGKEIIQQLKSTDGASNTTSQRKEHKSVISYSTLEEIMSRVGVEESISRPIQVADGHILEFKKRDVQKKDGFQNGTFTIYGRAAVFQNDGNLKTKIRLRVRIYLDVSEDFSKVERSGEMDDRVYLEIKIKNPTPAEKGGSNKYRIKLHDQDALKLFYADPHSVQFETLLEEIKSSAVALGNAQVKVDQVFDVIKRISQLRAKGVDVGREFLKPLEITTYVRESYSFTEKDYRVPSEV